MGLIAMLLAVLAASGQIAVQLIPTEHVDVARGRIILRPRSRATGSVTVDATLRNGRWRAAVPTPSEAAEITCQGEGLWCPTVALPDSTSLIELPVFNAATFEVELLAPQGVKRPSSVVVQGRVLGTPPAQFVETAAVRGSSATITLPSVRQLDLRLSVDGCSPIYFFAMTTAGLDRLGPLRFAAGASVSGVVVDESDNRPLAGVEMSLFPNGPRPIRDGAAAMSSAPHMMRSTTSQDGFFQFTNLEPGRYRLEFRSDDHPTRYLSVEVAENAEVHLDEIRLPAFVQAEVIVDPSLTPTGGRWTVAIRPDERSAAREGEAMIAASPSGKAVFRRVPPGGLEVIVSAADGEPFAYVHESVTRDRRIEIRIPLVTVKGKLRHGSVPQPDAGVTIQTGEGDAVRFQTDIEGRFSGTMRRPDSLNPTLTLEVLEPGQDVPRLVSYELQDPAADPLDLDIDLGNNRVWGTVIDQKGAPVADADVSAEAENLAYHVRAKTDEVGVFDLVGVPRGGLLLRATHPRGTSPKIAITVSDEVAPPLTLELGPWLGMTGVVLSSVGAPVAGAQLKILTDSAERKLATTNEKGEFSTRVSSSSRLSVVTVFAPSQVLWSTCVVIPRDERTSLRMPPLPGGTLSLLKSSSDSSSGVVVPLQPYLVTETGGLLSNGDLVSWRRAVTGQPGSSIDVPGLAAQSYGLVWRAYEMSLLVSAACSGQLSAEAKWDYLPPGGALRIEATRLK